jgi:hypothetical protein
LANPAVAISRVNVVDVCCFKMYNVGSDIIKAGNAWEA